MLDFCASHKAKITNIMLYKSGIQFLSSMKNVFHISAYEKLTDYNEDDIEPSHLDRV